MGKPEVNINTLNMESLKRPNFDFKNDNNSAILRNFQTTFFAMSRLASFPWTVSKSELYKCKMAYSECELVLFLFIFEAIETENACTIYIDISKLKCKLKNRH